MRRKRTGLTVRHTAQLIFMFLMILSASLSCENGQEKSSKPLENKRADGNEKSVGKTKYFKNYAIDYQGNVHYFDEINDITSKNIKHSRVYYDKNEQITGEQEYDQTGKLLRYSKTRYKNGLKDRVENYGRDHLLISVRFFDQSGRSFREDVYSRGQQENYILYRYDQQGGLLKEDHFSMSQQLKFYKKYQFDKKRKLIYIHIYSPEDKRISTYKEVWQLYPGFNGNGSPNKRKQK